MNKTSKPQTTGENEKNVDTPSNKATAARRELTARERAALERLTAAEPPVLLKVIEGENGPEIIPDYPDAEVGRALIYEELGTTNPAFADGVLAQLGYASMWRGQLAKDKLNFLFSQVISHKPKDERQAVLAVQMAVVEMAMMDSGVRLGHAGVSDATGMGTLEQQHVFHLEKMLALSTAERAFSRLACTYVMLNDALTRCQTAGEPKVTVQQYVLVSEGGQAIVGDVTPAEREASSPSSQVSPPALVRSQAAPRPPVECAARAVVPLARKAAKRNGKARP